MDTAPTAETTLWKGTTSQWVHFWFYLFCIVLAAAIGVAAVFTAGLAAIGLIVPLAMWVMRWYATKSTSYELTTERLRITTGVFSRHLDELELYRVKDYAMEQPFLLRLVGLGNLTLVTSDATTPTVALKAISGADAVRDQLRKAVEAARDRKRVRQMDVDSLDNPGGDPGHLHN